MLHIPKRPRIADVGLRKWLDESKDKHNGHGYDRFKEMLESDLDYHKTQIAKEFGVTKETVYQWLNVYKQEQSSQKV